MGKFRQLRRVLRSVLGTDRAVQGLYRGARSLAYELNISHEAASQAVRLVNHEVMPAFRRVGVGSDEFMIKMGEWSQASRRVRVDAELAQLKARDQLKTMVSAGKRVPSEVKERVQWAVERAEAHFQAAQKAEKAVDDALTIVSSEVSSGSPNLERIRNVLESAQEKVVVAEATGNLAIQYTELAVNATQQLLDPDALLLITLGEARNDYRPELPPHPFAPAGEAVGEGVVKGLEAVDWVETTALNIGGTVVTGAASLVTGGQIDVVTNVGDRVNKGLNVWGELSAKAIYEDGRKLDIAFKQVEKETGNFLDRVDQNALRGGGELLGL
ncbi:MAG: hypothetical protein R3F23_07210 [Verrucomicrobiia bacterium]